MILRINYGQIHSFQKFLRCNRSGPYNGFALCFCFHRLSIVLLQEFAKQLDAHFEQMMLSSQLDAADDYDEYESLSGEEEDTL